MAQENIYEHDQNVNIFKQAQWLAELFFFKDVSHWIITDKCDNNLKNMLWILFSFLLWITVKHHTEIKIIFKNSLLKISLISPSGYQTYNLIFLS